MDNLFKKVDINKNIIYYGCWNFNEYSCNLKNSKFKFNFKGNKIKLISDFTINSSKQISIYIDKRLINDKISQYCEFTKKDKVFFELDNLEFGEHIIEVINNENKLLNLKSIEIDKNGEMLKTEIIKFLLKNNTDNCIESIDKDKLIKISDKKLSHDIYKKYGFNNVNDINNDIKEAKIIGKKEDNYFCIKLDNSINYINGLTIK